MRAGETGRQSYLAAGLLIGVAFLVQYTLLRPGAGGFCPVLFLLPTVLYCGMFLGEWAGALCGLAAGICADAVAASGKCFHSLFFLLLGCAAGLLIRYLLNNTVLTGLLLSAGSVCVYLLLQWVIFYLLPGLEQLNSSILQRSLQSLLWTVGFSLPYYFFVRRLLGPVRRRARTAHPAGSE